MMLIMCEVNETADVTKCAAHSFDLKKLPTTIWYRVALIVSLKLIIVRGFKLVPN